MLAVAFFMSANTWAINLQNYYFSDAYKYAVIEDSLLLKHPGRWVVHLSGAYVKQPLVIAKDVNSGDKVGVVVDNHLIGTLGASYYLKRYLAIGADISYVKQSMSDETAALNGGNNDAIARAQVGIDCSAGSAGPFSDGSTVTGGTNTFGGSRCNGNENPFYNIQNGNGDVGSIGDVRLRAKWRFYRNAKRRMAFALLPAIDLPTGKSEAFNTSHKIRFNIMGVFEKVWKRLGMQLGAGYSHGSESELDVIDYDKLIKVQGGLSYRITKKFNANLELDYRHTIGTDSIPTNAANTEKIDQNSMDIYLTGKYKAHKNFDIYAGAGVAGFNEVDLGNITLFAGLKIHPGPRERVEKVKIIEEEPEPVVEPLPPAPLRAELISISDQTVTVGQSISMIDINELNSGMDASTNGDAINYVCTYDKVIDDAVVSGMPCTSLPGFQFDTTTGMASWTVPSGYEGEYEFNVDGFINGEKFDNEMWIIRAIAPAPVAAPAPAPVPEIISDRSQESSLGTLFRAERVYFNNNRTNIVDSTVNVSAQEAKLNEVAQYLIENEGSVSRVIIEGYASKVGPKSNNNRLSVGRSGNVKQYLIQRGVNPSLLETVSYGDDYLNEEPEHWQNRRVEFRIYNY